MSDEDLNVAQNTKRASSAQRPLPSANEWDGWAVVDGSGLVAQSWNEQFCIYTTRRDAGRSIKEHHTKRDDRVVRVKVSIRPSK